MFLFKTKKSSLLIFYIVYQSSLQVPAAAGGVSSHRVLLKKGAIWPGHPMSSHGVLGEKRVLSVRGISPPCPSCPHLPLTLETSSSTHGTNAAFLINWAMWLKPNINIKMEFSARNYVQFLLQKANYILQLFLLLPSYKCLQEVVQSKVSQSKSWQQLRAVRSKVNALHFLFCECFHTGILSDLMLWPSNQNQKPEVNSQTKEEADQWTYHSKDQYNTQNFWTL